MQTTKGVGISPRPASPDETCRAVVADLASVIEQVRNSLRLIESQIASGSTLEETAADDIVVLDDVTPGYARAYAVLRECDTGLSAAVRLLRESMTPGDRTREFVV